MSRTHYMSASWSTMVVESRERWAGVWLLLIPVHSFYLLASESLSTTVSCQGDGLSYTFTWNSISSQCVLFLEGSGRKQRQRYNYPKLQPLQTLFLYLILLPKVITIVPFFGCPIPCSPLPPSSLVLFPVVIQKNTGVLFICRPHDQDSKEEYYQVMVPS